MTAPFSGVVTARNVGIDALIANGNTQPLFKMVQVDNLSGLLTALPSLGP